jgi:hypothetical protein
MVATITVYFHPARTIGSMLEALICAFSAFFYAAAVSVASMAVSYFFESKLDLLPVGHAIVLLVFCGGGLGFVGWVKQRLSQPLVNVACSLASLAIITVLTKEGAVQDGDISFVKISQVMKMLLMGIVATSTVCFLVFPVSAKTKLRQEITHAASSMSEMLELITESFLQGTPHPLESEEFNGASSRNKKTCMSMDVLLREAKLEHSVAGTMNEYLLQKRLVRFIQDMTQTLGALRSAADLQFDILRQSSGPERSGSLDHGPDAPEAAPTLSTDDGQVPGAVQGRAEQARSTEIASSDFTPIETVLRNPTAPQTPSHTFEHFILHLGPSMVSLGCISSYYEQQMTINPGIASVHDERDFARIAVRTTARL